MSQISHTIGYPSIFKQEQSPLKSILSYVKECASQTMFANSIGTNRDIDAIVRSLLFISKKDANSQGYWRGYYDFTPKELKYYLSPDEFSYLLSSYYKNTTRWSNMDDHSYYQLHTNHARIIFHNSDIRLRYTQEEINRMTDAEHQSFCTLLPKEQETNKRDFWRLKKISVRLELG